VLLPEGSPDSLARFAKSYCISLGIPPSVPKPPLNKSANGSPDPPPNPGIPLPALGSMPYFSYIYFIKSAGGWPSSCNYESKSNTSGFVS
jgi:hypothetical protein